MKKSILLIVMLLTTFWATAQAPANSTPVDEQTDISTSLARSSLQLDINTISSEQASQINSFFSEHRDGRGFWLSMGTALLGTLINSTSSITIDEIMKITQIRKNQKEEWDRMIDNECSYSESISYINNLTDFYSEGSRNGALDPAGLRFNGFTLNTQKYGEDVLRFYCHVNTDEDGLNEIFNHSKFRLVLDSMYFYPYRCHLPNMTANFIFPDADKDYGRNTQFSFKDRENLMVDLNFTITSSWYNEAIILAKDVELGSFNIQIPINEEYLTDSVFIYKKDQPGTKPLTIAGDCFIVPRSYMSMPDGTSYWGTGEYNVQVTVSEECNISDEIRENWHKDYKRLKRMKKENRIGTYFVNLYEQNGTSVMRRMLETASSTAINSAL